MIMTILMGLTGLTSIGVTADPYDFPKVQNGFRPLAERLISNSSTGIYILIS